jgi:hypothetical protein
MNGEMKSFRRDSLVKLEWGVMEIIRTNGFERCQDLVMGQRCQHKESRVRVNSKCLVLK